MASVVCGSDCAPPSWSFGNSQLLFTFAIWSLFCLLGATLIALQTTSSMDKFRERTGLRHARLIASSTFCVFHAALGVSVCGLYCIRTYSKSAGMVDLLVEVMASAVYITDIVPDIIHKSLTSNTAAAKCLCTRAVPVAFVVASVLSLTLVEVGGQKTWTSWSFVASLQLLISWKRTVRAFNVNTQVLSWQLANLAVTVATLVFFSAMMVMYLEQLGEHDALKEYASKKWTTLTALYYVGISISTVGFGELVPRTGIGRLTATMAIIGGIASVSMAVSRVVQVISLQRFGLGSWEPATKGSYVFVTGNPTFEMMKEFVGELYHPDHDDDSEDLSVVCLFPKGCDTLQKFILWLDMKQNLALSPKVHALGGSVLCREDLERSSAAFAACFFVLPNTRTLDARREDTESITRALGIQNSLPNARIILLLVKSEHRKLALDAGLASNKGGSGGSDDKKQGGLTILAVDEFKMEMVGKTCVIPGFVTFLSNLCTSVAISDEEKELGRGGKPVWQTEYECGLGMEIYEVDLSLLYMAREAVFIEVCTDVLEQTGGTVYLIGLVESSIHGKQVLINPGPTYKLKQPKEHVETAGIFIASNREAVVQCEGGMVFLGRRERTQQDMRLKVEAPKAAGWQHSAEALAEEAAVRGLPPALLAEAKKVMAMVRSHRRSAVTARPPMKLIGRGGHILVLCVGASPTSGVQVGLEYVVRPLRRHLEFVGNDVRPIVFMAPSMPLDWASIVDVEQVYFLQGDPMHQFDLDRVNFRMASTIFVCRVGGGGIGPRTTSKDTWTLDSEIVSCVRNVESRLDLSSEARPNVVADLYCHDNHRFIPRFVQEPAKKTKPFGDLELTGAMALLHNLKMLATPTLQRIGILPGGDEEDEDQEELETSNEKVPYYRTPRYACGQLFVGTTVTSLCVNTFYNPTLCDMVSTMIASPMSRVSVPTGWVGKSYYEFIDHLLWVEQLLAIGIFREQGGVSYLYTAPPSKETTMLKNDLVVCFACAETKKR